MHTLNEISVMGELGQPECQKHTSQVSPNTTETGANGPLVQLLRVQVPSSPPTSESALNPRFCPKSPFLALSYRNNHSSYPAPRKSLWGFFISNKGESPCEQFQKKEGLRSSLWIFRFHILRQFLACTSLNKLGIKDSSNSQNHILKTKTDFGARLIACKTALTMLVLISALSTSAIAQSVDIDALANAIYKAENSPKHPYGILRDYCLPNDPDGQCRKGCLQTIQKRLRLWNGQGDFIAYLSKSYAPINAANDPTGLNRNWIRNVSYFYNQEVKK